MADQKQSLPAGAEEGQVKTSPKPKQSLKDIQVPNWLVAVILLGLIAVCALVFFLMQKKPAADAAGGASSTSYADAADPGAVEVEVLPQTVRSFDGGTVKNPFAADDLSSIRVMGIVSNSNGKSTAIIESDVTSFVVSVGDVMPESSWKVEDIGSNSVTFVSGESRKIFRMENSTDLGVDNK